MIRPRLSAITLAIVISLAACSNGDGGETTTTGEPVSTTTSTTLPVGPPPQLKITPIASVERPTAMDQRDGDPTLYVTEQAGRVRAIRGGELDPQPVLDITNDTSSTGERGLLGIAFAPGKGVFYINHTDNNGDTHITEYTLGPDGRADVGTKRELLLVDQPYANHNGGQLAFGPDGHLYIGLGDGGSAGDPQKNAQNLTVLLGKLLRINPAPSKDLPYTIPFDNPFAKRTGARGEIWAFGLRNPWRFSFDRDKGLWIADVGQNRLEEVNHVSADVRGGQNYGWPLREGTQQFDGAKPTNAVDPIYEYDRSRGACTIVGGYVYRGKAIPELSGRYLFGDYCNGELSTLTKRGTKWEADRLNISAPSITSFGEDHFGELYVLEQPGRIGRIDPA